MIKLCINCLIIFLFLTIIGVNIVFCSKQNDSSNETLTTVFRYCNAIGMSVVFSKGADYLIEKTEDSSNLIFIGFAVGLLSDFVLTEEGNNQAIRMNSQYLEQEKEDLNITNTMLNLSVCYAGYSLSRNPRILSGTLLASSLAFGNGQYSREKAVAGTYCLSGCLLNQLLPPTWDQNGVFLTNVGVYLLIDYLYPKEKLIKTTVKRDNDGQLFHVDLISTKDDLRIAWSSEF